MRRGVAAVALAACALRRAEGYGYEDIVPRYCNEDKDWGPLPPRPAGATELLQAQAFVRHGARVQGNSVKFCWDHALEEGRFTCELSYLENSVVERRPLTPNFRTVYNDGRNGLPGDCANGELSQDGFEMHVNNGIRLREAYVVGEPLLPATLEGLDLTSVERVFSVRSTDTSRTKQSAMGLTSGLYGKDEIGSLPYLPLRAVDQTLETMTVNEKVCPGVGSATKQFFSKLPTASLQEMRALCTWLNPDVSGDPQACFWWLDHLLDCVMSRVCPTVPFSPLNATVPASFELDTNAGLLRRVWNVVDGVHFSYFTAMAKVGAFGTFASEVYSAAKLAAQGSARKTRLLVWSGHDTGPMEPLMAALRLRNAPPFRPEFGSMLILELWNSTQGVLARWMDNGKVVAGPMPWSTFEETLGALAASGSACQKGETRGPSSENVGSVLSPTWWPIVPFAAVNLLFGAAAMYRTWRQKNNQLRLMSA